MKLKDWLIFKCISVPKFCKYNDFCEESVYTYIKGGFPRSNIAVKIVKATGGEVTLEDSGLEQATIDKIRLKQQKMRERKERDRAKRAAQDQVDAANNLQLTSNGSS